MDFFLLDPTGWCGSCPGSTRKSGSAWTGGTSRPCCWSWESGCTGKWQSAEIGTLFPTCPSFQGDLRPPPPVHLQQRGGHVGHLRRTRIQEVRIFLYRLPLFPECFFFFYRSAAEFKVPAVNALFDTLHAMCNLLVLPPGNLRGAACGDQLQVGSTRYTGAREFLLKTDREITRRFENVPGPG